MSEGKPICQLSTVHRGDDTKLKASACSVTGTVAALRRLIARFDPIAFCSPWGNVETKRRLLRSREETIVFALAADSKGRGIRLTALQRGLVGGVVRHATEPVVLNWEGDFICVTVQFGGYGSHMGVRGCTRREQPPAGYPRSLSRYGNQPLALDDCVQYLLITISATRVTSARLPSLILYFRWNEQLQALSSPHLMLATLDLQPIAQLTRACLRDVVDDVPRPYINPIIVAHPVSHRWSDLT
ncbi:predicted protein [Postia placenta Mad-698-R]|uniref:Uncharacterized protein n=1 Tax=Postia placenta MAD-698-R-SB12 TaxID=670580 RepID=A0A1X6MKJ7_9APHY|nr:hypothetical protein POSPLADRAFT_1157998 [Postia placenta MAD-698-R-SB12]EED84613.1 predicted protein [Postia placenta Mad-698-R]OSX56910.1 hypothetical protein POSPLADRAFT_1157998 [Postia placenta MAD-698-R-SB12]